jgi:hypothetical protein
MNSIYAPKVRHMESKLIEIAGQMAHRSPRCEPIDLSEPVTAVCERIRRLRGRPLLTLSADFIDEDLVDDLWNWRKELHQACLSKTVGVDVLINSPGGELNSCFTLAMLLSRWLRSWEALVPAYATSGATLVCLGAAKIVMSDRAHLGVMGPLQAFFDTERASAFEALQTLRQLRELALESIQAGVEFLVSRKVPPHMALETATAISKILVEPIATRIDPADLGRFSADSAMAFDYCTRIARPDDPERRTQRDVDLYGLTRAPLGHEYVIDLDAAKAMKFEVTEAGAELEDLFDELRPVLAKVSKYVGFVA